MIKSYTVHRRYIYEVLHDFVSNKKHYFFY